MECVAHVQKRMRTALRKLKAPVGPKSLMREKAAQKILYTHITAADAVVPFNDRVSSLEKVLANVGIKLGHLTMMAL